MVKIDRRMECDKLIHEADGSVIYCDAKSLFGCPKSRSRLIITSACWRVSKP